MKYKCHSELVSESIPCDRLAVYRGLGWGGNIEASSPTWGRLRWGSIDNVQELLKIGKLPEFYTQNVGQFKQFSQTHAFLPPLYPANIFF